MNLQDKTKEELILELQNLNQEFKAVKIAFSEDISKCKKAKDALIISETQYRRLFETAKDGILILDAGDGMIMDVNPFLTEILGYSKEQFLEKKIWEIGFFRDIVANYEKFLELQQKGYVRYEDLPLETASGKKINVEFVSNVYPVNHHHVIQCNIRDITVRKAIEQALKKSEHEFRSLAEAMPQIVWITDHDGSNLYFNQQWVDYTGLSLEESKGHGWNKAIHRDDRLKAWCAWENSTTNNAEYSFECRLRRTDGVYKWWLIRGVQILDTTGNVIKWFGTCTNIDDIKQTENELIIAKEQAEESERLKSAFLTNMSHEIRTPLNGILGFSDLLKKPDLSGSKQQQYISAIEKSGKRMLNTINDIVNISRIESGCIVVDIAETNINEQIENIYALYKPEADKKGLKLTYHNPLNSQGIMINTDKEKVYSILANLVNNAIKFTKDGFIEFGYTKLDNCIEFFVKDTGQGIGQHEQEVIFNRFRQGDEGFSRGFEGSGLGLSISKAYVEILGGTIWLESEKGQGSVFHFTIPCSKK